MNSLLNKIKFIPEKIYKQTIIHRSKVTYGHRLFLYFILGLMAGTFLLIFFRGTYSNSMDIYNKYFFKTSNIVPSTASEKNALYFYCLKKYFKEVIIICIINITSFSKVFNIFYFLYKGFASGVLISSMTLSYGGSGIVVYLISVFPQYISYIPLIIFTILFATTIRKSKNDNVTFFWYAKCILLQIILIIITAFLEAYLNVGIFLNSYVH